MLQLFLQKKYFDAIKKGTKTVEGRLNSLKFKNLHPGDYISFVCIVTQEEMKCQVQAIHLYKNFALMLQDQGLQNMLPGVCTIQEGVALYESFPLYKEKVREHGAIAITLQICSE